MAANPKCNISKKTIGPRPKCIACNRCGEYLCIECLKIPKMLLHEKLVKNLIPYQIFFCLDNCSSKDTEAIITEKTLEQTAKKYLNNNI